MTRETRLGGALLVGVIVVESVLVAGAFVPTPHTGGDNAGYVSLAHALLTTGSYTELFDPEGLPHTKYPPVFPGILALLIWLGARSWVALKSVAAVSTVLTVAFTYLWAARRVGPWLAAGVAALTGASSAVVYYSHWILSDPLFVALTMVSLWALDRDEREGPSGALWLPLGLGTAGLAYFTRSAGLPLVAAVLGWLAVRRRWRAVLVAAAAIGVPAGLWFGRGLGAPASYTTEFWLADPYQPGLGTIGIWALIPRVGQNLLGYVLTYGPGGIVGTRGAWVSVLGLVLTAGAAYGWWLAVRRAVGPAELFLPLYSALILLWPPVWSGDRFALPLYPLFFLFGAVALREVGSRAPPRLWRLLGPGVALAILVPSLGSWAGATEARRACAESGSGGAFGCYGPGVEAFATAAAWMATALPEGSAVFTRKPRIFYAMSGVPSRAFPFDTDPEVLLSEADRLGVRYVLLDEWDGLAMTYVGGAAARRPGAFCFVRGFGRPGSGGAQLLGILPPQARGGSGGGSGGEARVAVCPAGYERVGAEDAQSASSSSSGGRIPLLNGLDP